MRIFHCAYPRNRRFRKRGSRQRGHGARLTALFLCLCILVGFLPTLAVASDGGKKFSNFATIDEITLHYADEEGTQGDTVQDNDLIEADRKLALRYTYEITEEQCKEITAGTKYYLDISPHLELPNLQDGSPLTIESESGIEQFGMIYADGERVWIMFDGRKDGNETVLSDYGSIENAYFYLNCNRADEPPEDEEPLEGHSNLYAMKFENGEQVTFGYAENEPVTAKAKIDKNGVFENKTITWTINYTPWQNPTEADEVGMDAPFELQDTIDTSLHSYVEDSVKIGGQSVTVDAPGDNISTDTEAYVIVDTSEDGKTILTFGGTKFNAVESTVGSPAQPIKITYETAINDDLLLPGKDSGKKIINAAELFAEGNRLNIGSSDTVTIPQPTWLTKEGETTRDPGNGSTTDWTVTFQLNGFTFTEDNELTLHDQLPKGSTLVADSVKVDGTATEAVSVSNEENSFTVSPIIASGDPVTITYRTHVPEEMYDSGTNLGDNKAWFVFRYNGEGYETPHVTTAVGSDSGSGSSDTSTLVKTNGGYNSSTRTINWTVNINPHKAYLKSGTFTDDLNIGEKCTVEGHSSGLELVGGVDGIAVLIDGKEPTEDQVTLAYENQMITIEVGEIGTKTITLNYITKVCDPCIFANNTGKTPFTNVISTEDMVIGSTTNKVDAESTAEVNATVLSKKPPVYDYANGVMKWEVEVDEAGLLMEDVVLTDRLPEGLSYIEDSFKTVPEITDATADVPGQELTIKLGTVTGKTSVFFETKVDPETLGFSSGNKEVVVNNSIHMNGKADEVTFAEVTHSVTQKFTNHGLVKSSEVDNKQELIQYEVLINPFHLALPKEPTLMDTLDKRLQLDMDTLRFYKAELSGTTADKDQKPGYTKIGEGQPLKVTGYDPETNSFTVELPIDADSRDAYVLTYMADMLQREQGGYSNSVRFEGGTVLLGGEQQNSASVGGGGGGGGGVAARKASIVIAKTDSETKDPLAGVTFTLYQWDVENNARGIPFAQGITDEEGKLTFKVSPNAKYELVETESLPGYGSKIGWTELPEGAEATDKGILITAGAAKSELKLALTNEAHTTDIVFRLLNQLGIPAVGTKVQLFTTDPTGKDDPVPAAEAEVSADGTVIFRGMRRGTTYYLRLPDKGIMTVEIPAEEGKNATVTLPDGTTAMLTEDFRTSVAVPTVDTWKLTVSKVTGDDETIPLQGAEIGLYAKNENGGLILLKSDTSNEDGKIVFEGLMKGQTYWLKEIAAPKGYQMDSTPLEVREGNPSVTIKNMPEPEDPDEPETPDTPNRPNRPNKPNRPEIPDDLETTDKPEISDNLETSDKPETSNTLDIPGNLEMPDEGKISNDAETSGTIETPNNTDGFVSPDNIDIVDETANDGFDDADIPKTGDSTPSPVTFVFLLGIILTGTTVYHLVWVKRREKK